MPYAYSDIIQFVVLNKINEHLIPPMHNYLFDDDAGKLIHWAWNYKRYAKRRVWLL